MSEGHPAAAVLYHSLDDIRPARSAFAHILERPCKQGFCLSRLTRAAACTQQVLFLFISVDGDMHVWVIREIWDLFRLGLAGDS